ncbi:MAG: hypothetical protein IJS20_01620, partial [Bacteroidales bacterium]|nr:hypothetical protein [Bacteroidales bacterium]
IFSPKDSAALAKFLWNDYGFFLDEKKSSHRREALRSWAEQNIGPEAMAKRMEEALKRRRESTTC